MNERPVQLVKERPAESTPYVAAAIGLILSRVFGFEDDPELMAAVVIVVASVPSLVTFLVNRARG